MGFLTWKEPPKGSKGVPLRSFCRSKIFGEALRAPAHNLLELRSGAPRPGAATQVCVLVTWDKMECPPCSAKAILSSDGISSFRELGMTTSHDSVKWQNIIRGGAPSCLKFPISVHCKVLV